MTNFHIITATYIPISEKKPARIKLHSARFNQTLFIDAEENGTGTEYLRKKGFKIEGTGLGKGNVVIVSTTFEPLKVKKYK